MKILILQDRAIDHYNSGFDGLDAVSMIEFENAEHADYFKENYTGNCMNYKENMPVDEDVKFTMYHSYNDRLIPDEMFKPKGWEPIKLSFN